MPPLLTGATASSAARQHSTDSHCRLTADLPPRGFETTLPPRAWLWRSPVFNALLQEEELRCALLLLWLALMDANKRGLWAMILDPAAGLGEPAATSFSWGVLG